MDMTLNLPWSQKVEFARTHPINCCHESSVKSLRLLLHSKSVVPKLLPCCLEVGSFFFSIPSISPNSWSWCFLIWMLILMWSIPWNVQMSFIDKFEPLPDLIILTLTQFPTNLLKSMMNESVLWEGTNTMCIVLLVIQVYRAPYLLISLQPSSVQKDIIPP